MSRPCSRIDVVRDRGFVGLCWCLPRESLGFRDILIREDVEGRRVGVWATILNYGDLVVETAGEQENFVFQQAPDPVGLAALINKTHRQICEENEHNHL